MHDQIHSLHHQLAETEEHLRLIQERKGQYVLDTDVPLQLVKDQRRLVAQIADLRARLDRLAEIPCPYRGLEPFEARHANVYFGRDAMVERLVAQVGQVPLVAVVGPSGCGKSSLVRAGLVTALRDGAPSEWRRLKKKGALPESRDWAVRIFRPGRDPLRALAAPLVALLEPGASEVDRLAEARKLAGHLREGTLAVGDVVTRLRQTRPEILHLLLVVDQFEELYTECDEEACRRAFVRALLAAAELDWVSVLLTLRADFYGRVLEHRALGERVDAGLVNVLPMDQAERRAAIKGPTLAAGRTFEAGLVERILDDVAEEPGNLPLLEFALTELWAQQTARGVLTHAAYDAIGQVQGAVARRAEAVYGELEREGRGDTARHVFLRLINYGAGAESTRCRAALDEMVTPRTRRAALEPVCQALADARLLVTGREEATGAPTIEVAHEALIQGWERLRRWLDEDRAFGLWRERLAAARRAWRDVGRDAGALLRGAPLAEAEGWLAGRGDDLNEAERAFIEESLALREGERAARERRRRRLTLSTVGAAAIFLVLALLAWGQRQTAVDEAHTRATAQAQAEHSQATAVVEAKVRSTAQAQAEYSQATAVAEAEVRATAQAQAERQARVARIRALAGQAQSVLEQHPQRSLLLALEAFDRALGSSPGEPYIPAAEQALRDALGTVGGRGLSGHERDVGAVAFSPDGRWLATGSWDDTARLWDLKATGPATEPIILRGHEGPVVALAFSLPSEPAEGHSRWLATGSWDDTVRLWDLTASDPAAEPIVLRGHKGGVRAVAFSPEGRWLASGSGDDTARLWDLKASDLLAKPLALHDHESDIVAVAFSPNGRWLATGSLDATARLWDLAASEPAAEPIVLQGHERLVNAIAFSSDGRWLVTASSYDTAARLWDLSAPDPAAEPLVLQGHKSTVEAVAFSPDGRWLATTGGWDATARLWDLTADGAGAEPIVLRGHEGWVEAVTFTSDGHWLATGSGDATVRLWDLTASDPAAEPIILRGHEGQINAIASSPDGHWLATGSGDETARLWNLSLSSPTAEPLVLYGHSSNAYAVAFSPDGHWLATGSADGTARLWDLTVCDPGAEPLILRGHGYTVNDVAFGPHKHWLATAGCDEIQEGLCVASTARLWDLTASNLAGESLVLHSHEDWVNAVAFSPNGRWLATGSGDNTARLWDLSAPDPGAEPLVLRGHENSVRALAFSPDGCWLASGSEDFTARLWDLTALDSAVDPLQLRGHEGGIQAVAFSPDGRWLATGSYDGTARLWNLTASGPGAQSLALRGHEDGVQAVAFSPDGRWLATGSRDQTARIWDLSASDPAGEPLVLRGHESGVQAVAFSPDGCRLATGSLDGTARLWTLRPDDLVELVCRTAGRNLTRSEWDLYYPGEDYRPTCPGLPVPGE